MEETSSGGVQSDTPTDPVSSDPQFYGWVEQYSSEENFILLNQEKYFLFKFIASVDVIWISKNEINLT